MTAQEYLPSGVADLTSITIDGLVFKTQRDNVLIFSSSSSDANKREIFVQLRQTLLGIVVQQRDSIATALETYEVLEAQFYGLKQPVKKNIAETIVRSPKKHEELLENEFNDRKNVYFNWQKLPYAGKVGDKAKE